MNLNDFEKRIDSKILERGSDYYNHGFVAEIKEVRKGEWAAIVKGTESYNVRVSIKDGFIVSSVCDCPYDLGPVCKHETAVYFAIRDGLIDAIKEEPGQTETGENRIKRLLDKMDRDELIEMISNQALDDERLYNNIVACSEIRGKTESRAYYKKIVRSFLKSAMDRHGFINYVQAGRAAEGAFQLIFAAEAAFGKNEYEKAINIAQAVLEEMIGSLGYTDDSNGEAGSAIEDAFDILSRSAGSNLPPETRKSLFSYCIKESEKSIYNEYGEWGYGLIELAASSSASDNEMNLVLSSLERQIETALKKEHISEYGLERLSKTKYYILNKMHRIVEAERFFNENLHYTGFRRKAVEKALNSKEYDKAIKLALQGEKKDGAKRYSGLVMEWKEWRFKAYSMKEDIEEMRKLACDLIVNENEIKYYDNYKKSIPGNEWKEVFGQLKKKLREKSGGGFSAVLADILVMEKEFPELLDILKPHPGYVEDYQKYLLKTHPEDIYSLHMINIRRSAHHVSDRKHYQRVCGQIKKLKKIGGTREAEILINEFREKYGKRPAFMDELSKI